MNSRLVYGLLVVCSVVVGVITGVATKHDPVLVGIVTALLVFILGFCIYRNDLWKDGFTP